VKLSGMPSAARQTAASSQFLEEEAEQEEAEEDGDGGIEVLSHKAETKGLKIERIQ
jgi:hypothetical protein